MRPTDEQQAIQYAACVRRLHLVIEAGAGCAKTTTAELIAANMPPGLNILYTSFNKSVILEATEKMPPNVTCSTAHAPAWRYVRPAYRHRLAGNKWQNGAEIAKILGIRQPLIVSDIKLSPPAIARLAKESVIAWCKSADVDVQDAHIRFPANLRLEFIPEFRQRMRPYIDAYRADIRSATGQLTWTGDIYLKSFQLAMLRASAANPRNAYLGYDVVIFDEGQDSNPVMQSAYVDLQQAAGAQIIALGDSAQQINEWNGAVNALALIRADERLTLTQSFRFGPAIADLANRWLARIGTDLRLTGNPDLTSTIGPAQDADAILCRTNAEAMKQVMAVHTAGLRPMLLKGFGEILTMTYAARDLMKGRSPDHPDLSSFVTWGAVQDYAEQESDGGDLATFVKLIDRYGVEEVIHVAGLYRDVTNPDVTISTIHSAKGGEWPTVRIAADARLEMFDGLPLSPEEKRINYVGVTRAKYRLDPGPLDIRTAPAPGRHLAIVA